MKAITLIKSILPLTLISSILSLTVPITIQVAQSKLSVGCDKAILHYHHRDAIRGGSPFGGHQEQGFSNTLYADPNQATQMPKSSQLDRLLTLSDQIRMSLSRNLVDYELVN